MRYIDVHDQGELDRALQDKGIIPVLRGSGWFRVGGSSHVEAWGSSHVEAWGSSHVVARGSSHVVARESSHVVAWGSSHVVARGSSHVVAWGSSHVVAWGSSHVEAWGSSHVEASPYVSVHKLAPTPQITGGVIIELPDLSDPETWLTYHGVKANDDGTVVLYKAVDDLFRSERGVDYSPGQQPQAEDWTTTPECGGGLHLAPSTMQAKGYYREATRFVACTVEVASLVPIRHFTGLSDKCKVRQVLVCAEVVE